MTFSTCSVHLSPKAVVSKFGRDMMTLNRSGVIVTMQFQKTALGILIYRYRETGKQLVDE